MIGNMRPAVVSVRSALICLITLGGAAAACAPFEFDHDSVPDGGASSSGGSSSGSSSSSSGDGSSSSSSSSGGSSSSSSSSSGGETKPGPGRCVLNPTGAGTEWLFTGESWPQAFVLQPGSGTAEHQAGRGLVLGGVGLANCSDERPVCGNPPVGDCRDAAHYRLRVNFGSLELVNSSEVSVLRVKSGPPTSLVQSASISLTRTSADEVQGTLKVAGGVVLESPSLAGIDALELDWRYQERAMGAPNQGRHSICFRMLNEGAVEHQGCSFVTNPGELAELAIGCKPESGGAACDGLKLHVSSVALNGSTQPATYSP